MLEFSNPTETELLPIFPGASTSELNDSELGSLLSRALTLKGHETCLEK
jgi:hypothetical protein